MTTKTIGAGNGGAHNGTYTSGYTLTGFGFVTVTNTGTVEGTGLALKTAGQSVTNSGVLSGDMSLKDAGLALNDDTGGVAVNFGSISGYIGVKATAAPITLTNNASIYGSKMGVQLQAGGSVSNLATIQSKSIGADFTDGGSLTNGSASVRSALIEGYDAVDVTAAAGTVTNFGTIAALTGFGQGVNLAHGGLVTNGTVDDTVALIKTYGYAAVHLGMNSTISNFGTIDGVNDFGVESGYGQQITNGSATDRGALIEGNVAIDLFGGLTPGPSTVSNFGTIESFGATPAGIYISTGEVTNGGGTDRSALIEGASGVVCLLPDGGVDTIRNSGTIEALGGVGYYGVSMGGGTFANGSVNNSTALIEGYGGLSFNGTGAATNFGTIWSQGDAGGAGVRLGGGGSLTNGGASHKGAMIEGYVGVSVISAGVVANFGTIVGEGGKAVVFGSASDLLYVEADSVFIGSVNGDGGTLDLASGVGTVTGLLSSKSVTVSGSMAATAFSDFTTLRVAPGASFTMSGATDIAAGQAVIDSGTLTVNAGAGTIINAGTLEVTAGATVIDSGVDSTGVLAALGGALTVEDAVTGAGSVHVSVGTADFASTFTQNVTFTGATGVLELSHSQTYKGEVTGFSKTGTTSFDLEDIDFISGTTKATFAGTATAGVLTVTDGTHIAKVTLEGNYTTSTFAVSSDGHGGTKVVDPVKPTAPHLARAAPLHPFIAAAASFGAPEGGGLHTNPDAWRSSQSALATPRS